MKDLYPQQPSSTMWMTIIRFLILFMYFFWSTTNVSIALNRPNVLVQKPAHQFKRSKIYKRPKPLWEHTFFFAFFFRSLDNLFCKERKNAQKNRTTILAISTTTIKESHCLKYILLRTRIPQTWCDHSCRLLRYLKLDYSIGGIIA